MVDYPTGASITTDPTLDDITLEQLLQIMPRCSPAWHPHLVSAMGRHGIVTELRVCAFLAQIAHESDEGNRLEENLRYTTYSSLVDVPGWKRKFFPTQEASEPYLRNPEKLANLVYANTLGNGPPESGDGWKHRGGGWIQLTGKANYIDAAKGTGHPLVEQPELLRAVGIAAADTAGWFWLTRSCNERADKIPGPGDTIEFRALTKRINAAKLGLAQRIAYFDRAREVLL